MKTPRPRQAAYTPPLKARLVPSRNFNTLPVFRSRGGWRKGMPSPNPGGRPKALREVQALARERTVLAIEALTKIAQHGKNEHARVLAAEALLSRGWGKSLAFTEVAALEWATSSRPEAPTRVILQYVDKSPALLDKSPALLDKTPALPSRAQTESTHDREEAE